MDILETALRWIGGLGRALACVAVLLPSLAMNVWPKVAEMLNGAADQNALPIVLLAGVSVLVMAGCVVAIHKAETWGSAFLFAPLAFGLGLMNLGNATESASMFRDAQSEPRKATIEKAATLDGRIKVAEADRKALPEARRATAATVAAAQAAVDGAERNKAAECAKVGDNCRLRVADENAARAALSQALADKAATDEIVAAEKRIADLRAARDALGPIPLHADPVAVRIANVVGLIVLPFSGAAPEPARVSEWWPVVLGAGAEFVAMFGPLLILTVFPPPTPPTAEQLVKAKKTLENKRRQKIKLQRKKARGIAPMDVQSVHEWKTQRTMMRDGSKVRVGLAHRAYQQWCEEHDRVPVPITNFGRIMKHELGVESEKKNARATYHGLALVTGPKLVAKSA